MNDILLDTHTHILPNMDDGSNSVEQSIIMLQTLYKSGISNVVLTPHFYSDNEKIDNFIERRKEKFEILEKTIEGKDNMPKIHLGSEVSYFYSMSSSKSINKLSLEGTNYILIEMPFSHWDKIMVQEIIDFYRNCRLIPIIAHFERFLKYKNKHWIKLLHKNNILLQANCDFFIDNTKKSLKYLRKDYISLLGSDSHNMTTREPNFDKLNVILEKNKKKSLKTIENISKNIINSLKNN